MFMWDCIKSEGLHLGTCSDRFLFGSCCYHNSTTNDVDIQRPSTSSNSSLIGTVTRPTLGSSPQNDVVTPSPAAQQPTTSFLQSSSTLSQHLVQINKPEQELTKNMTNFDNIIVEKINPNLTSVYGHNNNQDVLNNNWTKYQIPNNTIQNSANDQSKAQIMKNQAQGLHQAAAVNVAPNLAQQFAETTTNSPPNSEMVSLQATNSMADNEATFQPTPNTIVTRPFVYNQNGLNYNNNTSHAIHQQINPQIQHQIQYQQDQNPTLTGPQKPQAGSSWLRPSLLMNAIIHTFKPITYLNPNRLRPAHRPNSIISGYRPQPQRPVMLYQRPTVMQSAGQQQPPQMSETNSYSNENMTQSSSVSSPQIHHENSDHHIVNPSSVSMTDRQRPIDKNNQQLDGNQKNNHYEILNNSTTQQEQSNIFPSHLVNNQTNYSNPNTFTSQPQYGMISSSMSSNDQTFPASVASLTSPTTPTMTPPSLPSVVISEPGHTMSSLNNNYEQHKPVLSFSQNHTETVHNFPSYPLISSLANNGLNNITANTDLTGPHFPPPSPIDEIPGLTIGGTSYSPTRDNTSTTVADITIEAQSIISNDNVAGSFSSNNNSTPGSAIHLTGSHVQPGPSTLPAGTIIIGNLDEPTPTTTALSVSSPSPSPSTTTTSSTTITTTTTSTGGNTNYIREPTTMIPTSSSSQTPSRIPIQQAGENKRPFTANKEVACGVTALYPQTKVVGGKNAAFGAWPWQVSVRKVSFFGFSSTHRCGGAVISSEWIATAGHCVEDLALQSIRIRVGEYDFSSVGEPYPHIERAARRKVVHPKYNFYTYENDLALVQLDQPLQFPPHIAPICLPPDNIDLLGRNATVTGWGRLNEGGTLPTILQEVRVPIVSNDKCKDMFLNAGRPEYIPDIFLCAGYEEGGRDSCQGDSGGPLQVRGDDGKWFLAGIISWGIGCAEQNLPGVCTRISRFKLWIQSTMSSS